MLLGWLTVRRMECAQATVDPLPYITLHLQMFKLLIPSETWQSGGRTVQGHLAGASERQVILSMAARERREFMLSTTAVHATAPQPLRRTIDLLQHELKPLDVSPLNTTSIKCNTGRTSTGQRATPATDAHSCTSLHVHPPSVPLGWSVGSLCSISRAVTQKLYLNIRNCYI